MQHELLNKDFAAENFPSIIPRLDLSEENGTDSSTKTEHSNYNITLKEIFHNGRLPIENMFLYCRWINKYVPCKEYIGVARSDVGFFYQFPNQDLHQKNSSDFKISQTGPDFGLTIYLNIYQEEYLFTYFSDTAGVKVLIHDLSIMPTPWLNGMSFSPGFQYEIAIKRKESVHLSKPYSKSKCIDNES